MEQNKKNYRRLVVVICLAAGLVPFMGSSLNLALPYINKELGLTAVTSSWLQTTYLLSTAIFQIPAARVADILGRRKIFLTGILLFCLSSLFSIFSTSGEILIFHRFMMGVGSAMTFSTSVAILVANTPETKRGKALGINTAAVYFSLASAPILGGALTQYLGWKSIFIASAIISFITLTGGIFYIKDEWKIKEKTSFDYWGSFLYAIGLFALIYGFSTLPSTSGCILTLFGALLLFFFGYYEKKQTDPVFNITLFLNNRVFRMSLLSALINYSSTYAISFMLSIYLQYVRGLSPQNAGLILVAQPIIMTFVTIKAGSLSDKSPTLLATLGMFIVSLGLLSLSFLSETISLTYIISALVFLGFGFGLFSSPNTNIIMGSVTQKDYSGASASMGTMRLTGQAFSMGLAMMAFSFTIGNNAFESVDKSDLILATRITFIVSAILCLIGVYTSSVRKKQHIKF
ncbi:MAG: MFS transporter [Bacteroidales bacterium]|nr:MFS transporter [Bacteroidales bacterium]